VFIDEQLWVARGKIAVEMDNEPEFVDAKEAARILRVTEQTIRRETRSGKIPAVKIGRGWRYLMDDLRRLTRQEQPPPD
jgi:excisionase family DNA binding protein